MTDKQIQKTNFMFERRSCLEHTFGDKIQNCGMCEAPIRRRLSNGYIQTRLWRGDQTQKLPCRNGFFISTCYGIRLDPCRDGTIGSRL
ncbi:hypothetical protein B9Z55_012968 [Caenorhabditis nigoni]|uniref:Uncharacterized protein n=1 Tax=Caenorhabditis nigoni TaxID=1611254 RepID=A0A2G5TZM7_9PELO|nr:hypothetical protein B9Z55_012968 [Caenorhabditis nigoni]